LVPTGAGTEKAVTGDLRYQTQREVVESGELMQVKVRYKQPDGDTGTEMVEQIPAPTAWSASPDFAAATEDTRFAAAVAAFGMILRGSEHHGKADLDWVHRTASKAVGNDRGGYRSGFVTLAGKARDLGVRAERPVR
jgi:Ca-activated chloride channel family protein